VTEALTTVIERFGLPAWLGPLVIALYVAGLPVTIYLVWRTAGVERRLTWPSFVGAMGFLVAATAAIFWFTRPAPPAEATTLAILPCAIATEADNASRAEGFAEDIHARLSRVDSVKIISWNSSLFVREKAYGPKKIAETLKANRLVRCRMGTRGERLAVSAQLIDPTSEEVLWNRNYDFILDDIGTVVTELARTLLDVLTTPVEAAELDRLNDIGTFSSEAYDLFLQARGNDDHDQVESLLTRALDIDPNYAEAIVARADNRATQLAWADYESAEDMDQIREIATLLRTAAETAMAIDPEVIGARVLLERACSFEREYVGGDCSVEEERQLNREECDLLGDTADGWACRHRLWALEGKDNDAALERWLELEPTNFVANVQYMGALFHADRHEEMLAVFETVRILEPERPGPYNLISHLLRAEGRLDEVLAWRFGGLRDQVPDAWLLRVRLVTDYMNLGLYEQAAAHAMAVHEGRPIYMPQWVAELWVRRGDVDEAIELLDWTVDLLWGGGATGPVIATGSAYIDVLGDFEKARAVYDRALAEKDLPSLCEADDNCLFHHALYLHRIAQSASQDEQAADWLRLAESAFDRMLPYRLTDPTRNRTRAMEAMLRIAQDRHDEALALLRDAVFSFETPSAAAQDLDLPIYVLDRNPLLDPLRERPEFQALLADYEAYLEPMRQRVLLATETGDWESLRQRTIRWIRGDLE
jgi:TolB-like protein/tetratricopeptide (TPR) repeat protein